MSSPTRCDRTDCSAPSHDTYSSYRWGCRSDAARDDYRRYNKRLGTPFQQVRRVPSIGSRRRLQALAALGHTWLELADELGVTWYRISRIARGTESPDWMQAATAQAITEVYDRLSMVPGSNAHTRSRAINRGWAPPLAFDNIDDPDEQPTTDAAAAAEPDVNLAFAAVADRLRWSNLTRPDAEYVVTKLRHAGREFAEIADLLRCPLSDITATWDRIRARELRAARAAA